MNRDTEVDVADSRMWNRNDALRCLRGALTALALAVPAVALAGATIVEPGADAAEPAPSLALRESTTYLLRCWQDGRLLFEEDNVELPPDWSQYAVRIRGKDRASVPVYVAETKNATCLLRAGGQSHRAPYLP